MRQDADELVEKILRRLAHLVLAGLPVNAVLEFVGTPPGEVAAAVLNGTVAATVLFITITGLMLAAGRRLQVSTRDLWATLIAGAVIGAAVTNPDTIDAIIWTFTAAFALYLAAHLVPAAMRRVADHRTA